MKNTHIRSLAYTVILILASISILAISPLWTLADSAPTCILNTIVQPAHNGGTTLSWRVYNATSVSITGIGLVSSSGTFIVYPQTTTIYTLTATGNGTQSCSVTALPVSTYTSGIITTPVNNPSVCRIWVRPDFVVPGGTGILSWDAGGAVEATISNGIGSVSNRDSRIIPNKGIPETYIMTETWGSGVTRTCSATLFPSTSIQVTPPVPIVYVPGNIVTVSPLQYIAVNQVPYTGTNDIGYITLLLLISMSSFILMYTQRKKFLALLS